MKIAHIVCVFPPYGGGIGVAAYQFACLNADSGHKVTVFTPRYKKLPVWRKDEKIKVRYLRPFFSFGKAAVLPQLFWQLSEFDLVILHYPFFGAAEIVYFTYLFKKTKAKLIVHYHMDVFKLGKIAKILALPSKLFLPRFLAQATIITAASFDYLEHSSIADFFLKFKPKFRHLPFAVDANIFQPTDKKDNSLPLTILFVGGLDKAHYFKGLEILLQAVSQLPVGLPSWRLQIVGDGDLRSNYENLSKKLKIADKVQFLGAVPFSQLAKIYTQADIFVLPSVDSSEAFGIVLLEAMASGLPLIASRLPGVRQVFQEGKQGFFFAPKDIQELKQKLTILLQDDNLRVALAKQARQLAVEKYSLSAIGQRLEKIVRECF